MSLYALGIIASMGLGPTIAGWIEANPSMGWRWIQWIHVMCGVISFRLIPVYHSCSVSGMYVVSVLLFMTETRSTVILTRIARQVRKDTRDSRYRARAEENKPALASMIAISCTRPLCKYNIHHFETMC
jgi:MFS family permease